MMARQVVTYDIGLAEFLTSVVFRTSLAPIIAKLLKVLGFSSNKSSFRKTLKTQLCGARADIETRISDSSSHVVFRCPIFGRELVFRPDGASRRR
jgi:hypothetical protein